MVLPSLFEEQIEQETGALERYSGPGPPASPKRSPICRRQRATV